MMLSGAPVRVVALLLPLALSVPRAASAFPFSSSVERFEVDGNSFGAADGTLDYVDEFDDGMLAPDWTPLLGTSTEANGAVTFHDPGTAFPVGGTTLELSNIELEDPVVNGGGNFTATSYWTPTLPVTGEFHFQVYELSTI